TKKRKQTAKESSSPRKSLKITIKQKQIVEKDDDDSEDRIELESHKENPEFVDDDNDKEEEKQNDDMGSLEIRNEETQITIPTPHLVLKHCSQHDEYQDDDALPEGEKRVKRSKKSKRPKSAREDNVIDEDEVIPEDETPELIPKFHNIDKHVPTIFNH
ncbi:hypothetical protein Tco_0981451, partial [Tanacetum coccineum]